MKQTEQQMNLKKILFKALGDKASDNPQEADAVAWFRVILMLQMLVTNLVIIAGVVHKW